MLAKITFLHKIKNGAIDKSYGINVAKLANIPLDVILRAEDILHKLEQNQSLDKTTLSIKNYQAPLLFDSKTEKEVMVLNKIKEANLYNMSPLEVMNLLDELQKSLKK